MPRFFTDDISDKHARVTGGDALHIAKSLRMRPGEALTLCDLAGFDYRCVISEVSDALVVADVLEKLPNTSEPPVGLLLYQALPKADKLELIAQKAVELGVSRLTPVLTSRCVSRWDRADAEKKLLRLQRIMLEAAKQSGRGVIPEIFPLCGFEDAINGMKQAGLAILFYEKAVTPLKDILAGHYHFSSDGTARERGASLQSIALMTGGEGGFSEDEARFAEQNGVLTSTLGPRILRCETAALCALSAISFAMGEF